MKINWLTITLLFLLVLNASMFGTFLYLQNNIRESLKANEQYRDTPEITPDPRMGRYFREALDLTPEQHEKFREIRHEFHHDGHQLRRRLHNLNQQFLDEVTSSTPDTARIRSIAHETGEIQASLKMRSFNYYSGMRELCRPDQVEKLDSLMLRNIDKDLYLRKHDPRHHFK